jgi:hypothetical protein
MKYLSLLLVFLIFLTPFEARSQDKKQSIKIGGDMGVWYEGYGLDKNPNQPVPDFYTARKPWNLLRYSFNPTLSVGKVTIPFNFNFSAMQNNFTTPTTGERQSVWEFLTNPINNFGIRPKIGSTEILLGTQTLQYSDLSTGDVGVFGYGVNLSPGKFRFKIFNGVSQRPIDYISPSLFPPNGIIGAYLRNQWMAQIGMESDEKYFVGFNFVKSSDKQSSVNMPPLPPIQPQDNVVLSFLAKLNTTDGWKYHIEVGQSFFTRDLNTPYSTTPIGNFKPFFNARTSSNKDNAVMLGIAKKGKDWEIGGKFNYYGAGYYTAGYPFMQNDKIEYLANTRFTTWKKKINVAASLGQRFGNLSKVSGPNITKQIITNVNVFSQFTDRFSINANFNNFGFNAASISGYKSVSNELSINPSYTWNSKTMSHMLSATYTHSKYDETLLLPPLTTTHNNTQTALLLYVPTFFEKKISPDFSLMWFSNRSPSLSLTLLSATAGMTYKPKDKFSLKGQLQYSLSTISPYTANKNLLATTGFDWELYKKLTWQFSYTANLYHYGTEIPGNTLNPSIGGYPSYLESTIRTGLQYRF